jgi:NTP pyrophosphatase (non-canonical NTP hydrolase)
MKFEEYQKKSRGTAKYPAIGANFVYPVIGLAGEAGEVANKAKKIFRDDRGKITPEKRKEISKELGDVLWYLSQVATEFGLELDAVADENIKRLYSRLERGQINGSGDNR